MKLSRKFEALPFNRFLQWKSSITYSELVSVPLAIQHAKVVRHIIFSFLTSPALQNISSLFNIRLEFRKKHTEH